MRPVSGATTSLNPAIIPGYAKQTAAKFQESQDGSALTTDLSLDPEGQSKTRQGDGGSEVASVSHSLIDSTTSADAESSGTDSAATASEASVAADMLSFDSQGRVSSMDTRIGQSFNASA